MIAPACLRTLADLLHARPDCLRGMIRAGRMGRGGSHKVRVVAGHGVQGRGPNWAEATRQWAEGARVATQTDRRDLVERMGAR